MKSKMKIFYLLISLTLFFSCEITSSTLTTQSSISSSSVSTSQSSDSSSLASFYVSSSSSVSPVQVIFHKLFGGAGNNYDEFLAGITVDEEYNIYFCGDSSGPSGMYSDIIYGKVDSNGNLIWGKVWGDQYADYFPDPGENAVGGGSAKAIKYNNGYLYLAGTHYFSTADNKGVFVLKIDSTNGNIVWVKYWKTGYSGYARDNAKGFALDVDNDYIYVTGTSYDEATVLLLVLNTSDGSIYYQKGIDISQWGYNDRGYTIALDGETLYIAGWYGANNYPFIAKLTNIKNPNSVGIEWIKKVSAGYASRINHIFINENNIYVSFETKGTSTSFVIARIDSSGNLVWSKKYDGVSSDKNISHIVFVDDNYVYAGGKIAPNGYDTQFGDGVLVRFNKNDGSVNWAGFYYTGTMADEIAEHRIKGIAPLPDGHILLAGFIYTGSYNSTNYVGKWILGNGTTGTYTLSISTLTASISNWSSSIIDSSNLFTENYINVGLEYVDASSKLSGTPPDCDIFIMKIKINQ